jgi:hypothetical protein
MSYLLKKLTIFLLKGREVAMWAFDEELEGMLVSLKEVVLFVK